MNFPSCFTSAASAVLAVALLPQLALAAPTQEDVFKSIGDSVGGQTETPNLLPILAAIAGFVLLLVVVSQRRKRVVSPKARNHHGKLLREIVKSVPIRNAELKQLKIVAEHTEADQPLASPLTLLLCPSLMAKTIQTKRMKVDRRALSSIARKAGLQVTRK